MVELRSPLTSRPGIRLGNEASQLTLAAFITQRQSELEVREQHLRKQLEEVRTERDQLRRAAIAAGLVVVPSAEAKGSAQEDQSGRRTLKDNILDALKDFPNGITAVDLLGVVNTRFNASYAATSVSPELTRLKSKDLVNLTGKLWHLPEYAVGEQEASNPELFEGKGSDVTTSDDEAHGVKASPGGEP